MTHTDELQAKRLAAADRYSAALVDLCRAYVELAALDAVIANARVGGELRTFGSNLDDHRAALHAHPLVSDPDPVPLSNRVAERRDELLEQVPG